MKKSNHSITFKVIIGYLLLTAFAAATVWFVYTKIVKLNKPAETKTSNKKMALISRAATGLYTAEGISRNIIQNKDTSAFKEYHHTIDTINGILDSLKTLYDNPKTVSELDSIGYLLSLKNENLIELLQFRRKNTSENYYDRVLKRLERADYIFGSKNYKKMVKDLKPYQQKVIIDYLNYAEKDNADRLTNRTADSLISTMKKVLLTLEMQEHDYQKNIDEKENNLLANDLNISSRLRKIRARIEQEEIQKSLDLVKSRQDTLAQTSKIMIVFGVSCVITILIFVVLIIRDTNKSKRYRKALEEAKAYAEGLLRSREQIMATVTHDLRSPLNSIKGYSDLLGKSSLSPKQNRYLRQLKKSSDYTMRLVNDLLDFSRLEAGKILVEALPFVPKNVIEDAVDGAIPSAGSKGLAVKAHFEANLQRPFIGDPFRIHQILTNLISNAYKFTEEGNIDIRGAIKNDKDQQILSITVEDSGIGISKKQQRIIFDEFSQADTAKGQSKKGFGLGLAISRQLAQLLKGDLKVESEPGKGSRFTLEIPVQPSSKLPERASKELKNIQIVDAEDNSVLLVDDDETQLQLTGEILTKQGFNLTLATDGESALNKINNYSFDVVLSDVQMPRLDGYELVKKLRKEKSTRTIPVIAISGEGEKTKIDYLENGFTDYLLKPFDADELLTIMARVLHLKTEETDPKAQEKPTDENHLFNLDKLKQFTDGDANSLKPILMRFVEDTYRNLEKLTAAQQDENWKQTAFVAHKMLPMLRQIEANKAVVPLAKIERYHSENLNGETLSNLIDVAKEQLLPVLNKLKKEIL